MPDASLPDRLRILANRATGSDRLLVAPDVMLGLVNGRMIEQPRQGELVCRYRGIEIQSVPAMRPGTVAIMSEGQIAMPVQPNSSWIRESFLNRSGPVAQDPLRANQSDQGSIMNYMVPNILADAGMPPAVTAQSSPSQPARPRKRERYVDV
jgi:hypothetical protein